jgi:CRP-like cAMP-binding protein
MNFHARSGSTENQLLAALPGSSLRHIEPYCVTVSLATGTIVHDVGDDIDHVYFPADGIASLQTVMRDGSAIDTALVGRNGAIGSMASIGPYRSRARCVVRSTIRASKIPVTKFRDATSENAAIQTLMIDYHDKLLSKTQTNAARYAIMSVDARLAACLLDVSSLLARDGFSLTQEMLAEMLAVRRTSVTQAAGKLQIAGIISYVRGKITVLDRARLTTWSQRLSPVSPSDGSALRQLP